MTQHPSRIVARDKREKGGVGLGTGLGMHQTELQTPPLQASARQLILQATHLNVFLTVGTWETWSSLSVENSSKEASEISIAIGGLVSSSPSSLSEWFSAESQTDSRLHSVLYEQGCLENEVQTATAWLTCSRNFASRPEVQALCLLVFTARAHLMFHLNGTRSPRGVPPPTMRLTGFEGSN